MYTTFIFCAIPTMLRQFIPTLILLNKSVLGDGTDVASNTSVVVSNISTVVQTMECIVCDTLKNRRYDGEKDWLIPEQSKGREECATNDWDKLRLMVKPCIHLPGASVGSLPYSQCTMLFDFVNSDYHQYPAAVVRTCTVAGLPDKSCYPDPRSSARLNCFCRGPSCNSYMRPRVRVSAQTGETYYELYNPPVGQIANKNRPGQGLYRECFVCDTKDRGTDDYITQENFRGQPDCFSSDPVVLERFKTSCVHLPRDSATPTTDSMKYSRCATIMSYHNHDILSGKPTRVHRTCLPSDPAMPDGQCTKVFNSSIGVAWTCPCEGDFCNNVEHTQLASLANGTQYFQFVISPPKNWSSNPNNNPNGNLDINGNAATWTQSSCIALLTFSYMTTFAAVLF